MVSATELAGDAITSKVTEGAGFAIGGLKVSSEHAWFAARPSGTEDIYKIYAESTKSADHLRQVLAEARVIVDLCSSVNQRVVTLVVARSRRIPMRPGHC